MGGQNVINGQKSSRPSAAKGKLHRNWPDRPNDVFRYGILLLTLSRAWGGKLQAISRVLPLPFLGDTLMRFRVPKHIASRYLK